MTSMSSFPNNSFEEIVDNHRLFEDVTQALFSYVVCLSSLVGIVVGGYHVLTFPVQNGGARLDLPLTRPDLSQDLHSDQVQKFVRFHSGMQRNTRKTWKDMMVLLRVDRFSSGRITCN